MTASTLPPFPVDDVTLDVLEHAIAGALQVGDDGVPVLVGGDMSVSQLLEFLSGYDPSRAVPLLNEYDTPHPDWTDYPDSNYHSHDVIRALIAEVRRLRAALGDTP